MNLLFSPSIELRQLRGDRSLLAIEKRTGTPATSLRTAAVPFVLRSSHRYFCIAFLHKSVADRRLSIRHSAIIRMNAGEVAIPNRWYASPHLVHRGRLDRRRHSEVSDARAYDPFLDHRARHHWRHPGRGRNSHIRAANKPTVSPCGHYPLDAGCNSYPIRLHQTADSFPPRRIDDFFVLDVTVSA